MHQFHVPLLPMSERITFAEFGAYFETTFEHLERQGMATPPILLYEVVEPGWLKTDLKLSEIPERMVVAAYEASIRNAVMEALRRVELREPPHPASTKPVRMKLKGNTQAKSIFKQMAEHPLTVFSFTFEDDQDSTIFFLRTAFTISEVQKELPNCIVGGDQSN